MFDDVSHLTPRIDFMGSFFNHRKKRKEMLGGVGDRSESPDLQKSIFQGKKRPINIALTS